MLNKFLIVIFTALPLLASAQSPLTFPYEIVDGTPFIKASIDGQVATLLVDLGGAGELSLKPSLIGKAELKKLDSQDASINALGQRQQSDNYRVNRFVSGAAVESNLVASVWNSGSKADGYLGIGYLRKFRIVLDDPRHEMRLYRRAGDDASATPCEGKPIPIKTYGTVIYTEAKTDFGTRLFALDTGANANVLATSQKPEGDAGPDPANPLHHYQAFSLNGQDVAPGRFVKVDIRIPLVSGVLGRDFFEKRVVCLDLVNNVMTTR